MLACTASCIKRCTETPRDSLLKSIRAVRGIRDLKGLVTKPPVEAPEVPPLPALPPEVLLPAEVLNIFNKLIFKNLKRNIKMNVQSVL